MPTSHLRAVRPLAALSAVLAGALLAGCGATARADPDETAATAETALAAAWAVGGLNNDTWDEVEYWALVQQLEALSATPETAAQPLTEELEAELDAFCAAQPDSFSLYLQDLATNESYEYAADTLYYPASLMKVPYALWLCGRADTGEIDLDTDLPNRFAGSLAGTALADYDALAEIPAKAAMLAMLAHSDNNAVTLLTTQWPAGEDSGFQEYLTDLGFCAASTCAITPSVGIVGVTSAEDFAAALLALYDYLDAGGENAALLQSCMEQADHDILYIPAGVSAVKKYGSWDYAYHDMAIVYADTPYLVVCMTDRGNADEDFPAAPTQAMQQLGQLIYDALNP